MNGYVRLIQVNLKLALRERVVIFFNYIFPLIFFFVLGQMMEAGKGGIIVRIVTMVLVIGILGNGLFGGGIRAVQERELNILRRFKVAPISPAPMLVASMVTGWALYMPAALLTIWLAHFIYGMPLPERWVALLVLVSAGVLAFRAIGLIIASVANSAQESQILVQLVYMPMLFLTGTTFSVAMLPSWAQTLSQFLPATYLVTGLQGVLIRRETLADNWAVLAILGATTVISMFLSMQLFRWEKEEKLRSSAKLWLLVMVFPSLLLGGYHAYSREHVEKTVALHREVLRSRTLLIRNGRILGGDGLVIENGAVLVRGGRIAEIYHGPAPDAEVLRAEAVEASGKTVLPGLIDAQVQLAAPGGAYEHGGAPPPEAAMQRALAAYLYSGVTAVRSKDELTPAARRLAQDIRTGKRLGAEVFVGSGQFPAHIPALSAAEGVRHAISGDATPLKRSLVQQVSPPALLRGTLAALQSPEWREWASEAPADCERRRQDLLRAYRDGVPLVAGSGAGSPLVLHGPALQRELQLWVEAGIPQQAALQAATANAARLLGAEDRIGSIRKGNEADLLVVDGNPLQDITALERISLVFYKGERIDRARLFEQE